MGQSVHTARWIDQISDQGWNIHVFDLLDRGVCPELSGVTSHSVFPPPREANGLVGWKSDFPFRRGAGFVRRNSPAFIRDRIFPPRINSLVDLIREFKPDIIHSLEMQNESYPLLEVRRRLGSEFAVPWIYSSWGNDIYHFGKQPEHSNRIRDVLAEVDYFIADCERDVRLARDFGFAGEVLGVFPTAGSYDIHALRQATDIVKPSLRRSIALKGYQSWQGRALLALDALQLCAAELAGYRLEIYLPVPAVEERARAFSLATGIPVTIHDQTLNIEILKLFGRSRIGFSMSITDGWPNSMLETMIMGAFPVQSDTVSTAEWITGGENGLLIPPEDPAAAAVALKRSLADDEMVDRAADINYQMVLKRIDRSVNKPQIVELYKKVFAQGKPFRLEDVQTGSIAASS